VVDEFQGVDRLEQTISNTTGGFTEPGTETTVDEVFIPPQNAINKVDVIIQIKKK